MNFVSEKRITHGSSRRDSGLIKIRRKIICPPPIIKELTPRVSKANELSSHSFVYPFFDIFSKIAVSTVLLGLVAASPMPGGGESGYSTGVS